VNRAGVIVPLILPAACAWVAQQERSILRRGVRLTPYQMDDARRAGILHPDRVRVRIVDEIPIGMPSAFRAIGKRLGLVSSGTIGMSLRYGILVRADAWDDRHTIVHEFAHTAQYERLGGLWPFLRRYLHECLTAGYANAPLEDEACLVSRRICG
jgi:hypothetical protein